MSDKHWARSCSRCCWFLEACGHVSDPHGICNCQSYTSISSFPTDHTALGVPRLTPHSWAVDVAPRLRLVHGCPIRPGSPLHLPRHHAGKERYVTGAGPSRSSLFVPSPRRFFANSSQLPSSERPAKTSHRSRHHQLPSSATQPCRARGREGRSTPSTPVRRAPPAPGNPRPRKSIDQARLNPHSPTAFKNPRPARVRVDQDTPHASRAT